MSSCYVFVGDVTTRGNRNGNRFCKSKGSRCGPQLSVSIIIIVGDRFQNYKIIIINKSYKIILKLYKIIVINLILLLLI